MFTLNYGVKLDRINRVDNGLNIIILEEYTMDNNNSKNDNDLSGGMADTDDIHDVGKKADEIVSEKPINITREIIDWAIHIIGAIAIALLIVKFVAQVTVVIGSSMLPTLQDHNRLMMEKITPRFGTLHRGDIVVLEAEKELLSHGSGADRSPLIKRVIGVEGDHIKVSNGKVFVNEVELTEKYINGNYSFTDQVVDVKVDKDKVFVMGDNRPRGNSIDSRILGTFNKSQVIGRVMFRLWPLNEFGGLNK